MLMLPQLRAPRQPLLARLSSYQVVDVDVFIVNATNSASTVGRNGISQCSFVLLGSPYLLVYQALFEEVDLDVASLLLKPSLTISKRIHPAQPPRLVQPSPLVSLGFFCVWWPKRKQLHVARHASAIIRTSPPPTARSFEEAPLVSHCPANVDAVEAVSLVDGLMPKPNGIRTSFLGEGDDRWLEG